MSTATITPVNWGEFHRRSDELFKELQKTLLPEHADEIIAIDVDSGGYVLSRTRREAIEKFRLLFPGKVSFIVRVDGGPIIKYHDRLKP